MATARKQKTNTARRKNHSHILGDKSIWKIVEAPKTLEMTHAIAKPNRVSRKYFKPLQAQMNKKLRSSFSLVFIYFALLRVKYRDKCTLSYSKRE
jgi:hypothetical protein